VKLECRRPITGGAGSESGYRLMVGQFREDRRRTHRRRGQHSGEITAVLSPRLNRRLVTGGSGNDRVRSAHQRRCHRHRRLTSGRATTPVIVPTSSKRLPSTARSSVARVRFRRGRSAKWVAVRRRVGHRRIGQPPESSIRRRHSSRQCPAAAAPLRRGGRASPSAAACSSALAHRRGAQRQRGSFPATQCW
jgi:hypothetical protein